MTIVVGDLHLTRHSPPEVARDFSALLAASRGERVAIAGDLFDLSTDTPHGDRGAAVREILGSFPTLQRALAEHLLQAELIITSGNHDADLAGDAGDALARALELAPAERARLTTSPWFWRDGDLHIEHGHLYDPDNAPAHPLVNGEPSLGVHFSAEFMNPTGAYRYLSNNDGTPLTMFLSAFRWYGKRAPYVVYRYFHTAFAALLRSGPLYRAGHEHALGEERQARFAQDAGVPAAIVDAVLGARAPATLESWSQTFARLYLDRVSATLLCAGSAGSLLSGRPRSALALGTLGAMLMSLSWLRGHDRYGGSVVSRLDQAADRLVEETGAGYVVFGHTHREALSERYANTSSFAFPRDAPGRPYLRLERRPHGIRAERQYQPMS